MQGAFFDSILKQEFGVPVHTYGRYMVGGGSVNQAYKLVTERGTFFVKLNHESGLHRIFEKEIHGLKELARAGELEIAKPVGSGVFNKTNYLIEEWIEQGPADQNFWEDFGFKLAKLHKHSNTYFGFAEDNFIGTLPQINSRSSSWSEFFIHNRLEPLVRSAANRILIDAPHLKKFTEYLKIAESVFPVESPALLHGDLWTGNLLRNDQGEPVLIDPAVYYGHREMDLAMTFFVGNFPEPFYSAYVQEFPLAEDWRYRMDFGLMYYQLVHLHLYGHSYLNQIYANLNRWT